MTGTVAFILVERTSGAEVVRKVTEKLSIRQYKFMTDPGWVLASTHQSAMATANGRRFYHLA